MPIGGISPDNARVEEDLDRRIERLLPGGAPDWGAIDFDILCPRCDYNLRTLTHRRCPECGLDVDWRAALEHALVRTELLFEHAWRRRPIRSWLMTTWWTLSPRRFWERVSIHDRVRVGPLAAYLLTTMAAALATLHCTCWLIAWPLEHAIRLAGDPPNPHLLRLHYQLERVATSPLTLDRRYLLAVAGLFAMLAGIVALVLALRRTWCAFRIRGVQVFRMLVYALTPAMFYSAVVLIVLACFFPLHLLSGPVPFMPYVSTGLSSDFTLPRNRFFITFSVGGRLSTMQTVAFYAAQLCCLAVCLYCLRIGFSRYLQMPKPWSLATMTVLTAALFGCTVVTVLGLAWSGGLW